MANTQKYINHLLQNTGITPACSEEEREAAELIANIFSRHGFEPEVQEFSASSSEKTVQAVLGIVVFLGSLLMCTSGILQVIGAILAIAAAVVFFVERMGKPVLSQVGSGGLSQNVIAYHQASGPLASPRNRPVVVVAHYDSPRADLLCQEPFSKYRPQLVKALPACMVAPIVFGLLHLLPFPSAFKIIFLLVSIVTALVPLANAVAIIANRLVLPYTSGSVCNKSSVAAMLGVMDQVAPFEGEEEFPDDIPFDEYFSEQVRMAEEAAAAAEAERLAREEARQARFRGGKQAEEEEGAGEGEFVDFDAEEDMGVGSTATMADFDDLDEVPLDQTEVVAPFEEEAAGTAVMDQADGGQQDVAEVPAEAGEDEPEAGYELEEEAELEPEFEPEPVSYPRVTSSGNLRFGAEIVSSLGMLSEKCVLVYEEPEAEFEPAEPSQEDELEGGVDDEYAEEQYAGNEEQFDVLAPEDGYDSWQEGSDEYESDFYGAEDNGQGGLSVGERLRDGASRLFSFVKSKVQQVGSAPTEGDEFFDSDEPAAVGSDFEQGAALDEELAPEVDEVEKTAVEPSLDDAAVEEAEPEPERTVARTAVIPEQEEAAPATAAVPVEAPAPAPAAQPARQIETVDSLMAEISAAAAPAPRAEHPVSQRILNLPSVDGSSTAPAPGTANRSSLFDLPDPAAEPVDPFASLDYEPAQSAPAAASTAAPASQQRRQPANGEESMSDWLGVDSDYDAKRSGREIGSWANFEDDSSWKGGATSSRAASEDELRGAITSLGDDELLGHDIWFVAAGASENGNAGIKQFLRTHRDKLRGVFVINLECVGAGQLAMIATEGQARVLKGDRRIMGLVSRVSSDFHHEIGSVEMPYLSTDAYASMNMSLRSLTIGGVEGSGFALSHSEDDQPYNVDADNISFVADVVTEVIRRS